MSDDRQVTPDYQDDTGLQQSFFCEMQKQTQKNCASDT
jgi:hypothetical protein